MLTDERIGELYTKNNGFNFHVFARAIEVEALQSQPLTCSGCGSTMTDAELAIARRDCGVISCCPDRKMEAQELVAWFAFADSNGPVPLELWGFDEKACKHAVLENARSVGWKGTVEGYLFQKSWTIRPLVFAAPQPVAPSIDVDVLSNIIRAADGNHSLGAGALAEKIVEAIGAQPPATCSDYGTCDECGSPYSYDPRDNGSICVPCMVGSRDALQAKVADLECEAAPRERLLDRFCNTIAAQAALIERCEQALGNLIGMQPADEALAAIEAHRSAAIAKAKP